MNKGKPWRIQYAWKSEHLSIKCDTMVWTVPCSRRNERQFHRDVWKWGATNSTNGEGDTNEQGREGEVETQTRLNETETVFERGWIEVFRRATRIMTTIPPFILGFPPWMRGEKWFKMKFLENPRWKTKSKIQFRWRRAKQSVSQSSVNRVKVWWETCKPSGNM